MNVKWAVWSAMKNSLLAVFISNFVYFFIIGFTSELLGARYWFFGFFKGLFYGFVFAVQALPLSMMFGFLPGFIGWFMYCWLVVKFAGRTPALWKRNVLMVVSVFASCFICFGWWRLQGAFFLSCIGLIGALILVNKKHVSYYSYLVD